jgi:LysR family transcriptional activator of nhaA
VCAAVLPEVIRQYGVEPVGNLDQVRLQFYAITLQRKLTHPAVVAISQNAKEGLLAPTAACST